MKVGRELDALVAEKVMGVTPCDCTKDEVREFRAKFPGASHYGSDGGCSRTGKGKEIPHYSTSISAAWEVVEHFREEDNFSIEMHGTHWKVHFGPKWAGADTAPHTICLAALRAVGAL